MTSSKFQNHTREEKKEALGRVLDVLDTLRVKCPWDAKQTNESLRPNTIEEVYELCDALIAENDPEIAKELGDVLLHILFYAKIGEEKQRFDIVTVCDALASKLIYRHPHVYGDTQANSAHQVELNWEQLKLKEKDGNRSVLAGVPSALPALTKAFRIQEKAANAGFDWQNPTDVWAKVNEEIKEFAAEAQNFKGKDDTPAEVHRKMEAEMGDLLFSLINAARLYGLHPDNALDHTNRKFIARFNYIEQQAAESGRKLLELSLEEMEELWQRSKISE